MLVTCRDIQGDAPTEKSKTEIGGAEAREMNDETLRGAREESGTGTKETKSRQ